MTATTTLDRPQRAAVYTRSGRTVAYARISRDRVGRGLGVERQLADCREVAADAGLSIVATYSDNDLSGYSSTKPRPGYEAVVALIEAGEVDVLLCWHLDRLTRRLSELADLIRLCQRHGVRIETRMAGQLDPNDPAAVMTAQVMGSLAEYESALKSSRIKLKIQQNVKDGKMHGGRRRWGYTPDMSELVDVEAELIRETAGRLLNGESLAAVARWLNSNGHTGPEGAKFTGPNVRNMILRPHLAGLRVYRREVVGQGEWPQVFDVATHEALKVKLEDPTRRTSYSNARKRMLAGLALCGECGARLKSTTAGRNRGQGQGWRGYECAANQCVHRRAQNVEERVTDWVVERLSRMDARGMLVDDSVAVELADLTMKLTDLEPRRERLAERWATGELDDAGHDRQVAALDKVEQGYRSRMAELSERVAAPQRALEGLTGPNPAQVFAELELGRQRAVVDLLCTVYVDKAERRGAPFDPASVRIEPKSA